LAAFKEKNTRAPEKVDAHDHSITANIRQIGNQNLARESSEERESEIEVRNSKNYLTFNHLLKSKDELISAVNETVALLSKRLVDAVNDYGAKLMFFTRPEAKENGVVGYMGNALGCFDEENKGCYVFPSDEYRGEYNIDHARFLRSHTQNEFESVQTVKGFEGWKAATLHELSHAVCNYNNGEILEQYREHLEQNAIEIAQEKNDKAALRMLDGVISDNSKKCVEEDLCEMIEFYARNRELVDTALANEEKWILPGLRVRFEFVKQLWKDYLSTE